MYRIPHSFIHTLNRSSNFPPHSTPLCTQDSSLLYPHLEQILKLSTPHHPSMYRIPHSFIHTLNRFSNFPPHSTPLCRELLTPLSTPRTDPQTFPPTSPLYVEDSSPLYLHLEQVHKPSIPLCTGFLTPLSISSTGPQTFQPTSTSKNRIPHPSSYTFNRSPNLLPHSTPLYMGFLTPL